MGRPSFSPPLTSNFMFYAYSGQSNWRLAEFFPTPSTRCTTVFPDVIILCIRLMFNHVRVGKEWVGQVFPHPLKSKGYICIHDRVRLAEFFCRWLTICTTVCPHLLTFWTRLMFNLVRVGKEWAGPVFPHPLIGNGYMCIHDRVRLAVFFRRRFTICTTVFPYPISFWTRLLFNLVRVGKEWAGPVFPHPQQSKGYMCIRDRIRLAVFYPDNYNLPYAQQFSPYNLLNKVDFKPCQCGEKMARPSFSPPQD